MFYHLRSFSSILVSCGRTQASKRCTPSSTSSSWSTVSSSEYCTCTSTGYAVRSLSSNVIGLKPWDLFKRTCDFFILFFRKILKILQRIPVDLLYAWNVWDVTKSTCRLIYTWNIHEHWPAVPVDNLYTWNILKMHRTTTHFLLITQLVKAFQRHTAARWVQSP